MARPTKPKDVNPDEIGAPTPAAGGGGSALDLKFILTILLISVVSVAGSAASIFFLAPMVMGPVIAQEVKTAVEATAQKAEGEGEGEGEAAEHGEGGHETVMNLELDEFTVNLKPDPSMGGNQFLRTKMSLSVAVPPEEFCDPTGGGHAELTPSQNLRLAQGSLNGGVIAGAAANITQERLIANSGPDPYTACIEAFNKNMARYVPSLRDIINQALMKRTAGTLASIEGQELLKDEIKTEANHLMGHYQVSRINFSDFIIQY